jgi:hypothetical protein
VHNTTTDEGEYSLLGGGVMNIRLISLVLILFLNCVSLSAQRRGRRPTVKPVQSVKSQKKLAPNYQLNLKIVGSSQYTVSITSSYQQGRMDPEGLTSLIGDLPGGNQRIQSRRAFPKVVVEPSPDVTMLDLWNPITLFPRGSTDINVYIPGESIPSRRLPSGLTLIVPWTADENLIDVKPNPLFLVVKLDEHDKLSLNNEPAGTILDTEPLTTQLQEIFKAREENGVFRENSNEIDKDVTIVMPMDGRKFSDLIKIADNVYLYTAARLYLVMDGPLNSVDQRKPLVPIPDPPRTRHD